MKFLDIGEVSRRSGLKPSALRYYEEAGLITSVTRHGLRRQFAQEVLMQLQLIALAKSAGFSLEEIAGMFGRDGLPALDRLALRDKADEIDRKLRELTVLRDTLRHVAACAAPSHLECPQFQRLLTTGGKSKARHRKLAFRADGL